MTQSWNVYDSIGLFVGNYNFTDATKLVEGLDGTMSEAN